MKLENNNNTSNKSDLFQIKKIDFSRNDSFGLPQKQKNSNNLQEIKNDNYTPSNIDPRLELTLKYLDISSTINTFIINNISFNDLMLLSRRDLIELGLTLVQRNRILSFSEEYKQYGKQYTIQEIDEFFKEFQNLNIKLNSINNFKSLEINNSTNKNGSINSNIVNYNNNINKINHSIKTNKASKHESFQDSLATNLINNQNSENVNNDNNNSKLIRQNSKASRVSKTSSYSKYSKSKYVSSSKNILSAPTNHVSLVQKYKNLSDEIDNYFKKYNDYKKENKNKTKQYQIIRTGFDKKNYSNQITLNDNKYNNDLNKKSLEYNNNMDEKINKDILIMKLKELQKRKKELNDKLNLICERENKKKMIIKYLEEEENNIK